MKTIFCPKRLGLWLALLTGFSPVLKAADASAKLSKPNVLFIAIDDLNHWVGYLGGNPQTKTPNMTGWRRGACGSRGVTARRRSAILRAPR